MDREQTDIELVELGGGVSMDATHHFSVGKCEFSRGLKIHIEAS